MNDTKCIFVVCPNCETEYCFYEEIYEFQCEICGQIIMEIKKKNEENDE